MARHTNTNDMKPAKTTNQTSSNITNTTSSISARNTALPTSPSKSRSPQRHSTGFSSFLKSKRKPPTYKADFPVPALAYAQKGGFYSQPELEQHIKHCPNKENVLHVCTAYCYEHYAQQTSSEALMQQTGSQACMLSWVPLPTRYRYYLILL